MRPKQRTDQHPARAQWFDRQAKVRDNLRFSAPASVLFAATLAVPGRLIWGFDSIGFDK